MLINNWYFALYGSLTYKIFFSMSDWWFIRLGNLTNAFLFLIQSPQLLVFYMDDGEFQASLDCVLCFLLWHHQSQSIFFFFLYCFIIFSHLISLFLCIIPLFVPHAYSGLQSINSILLSLLPLKAMLSTFSVNTLCASLFNLYCNFSINLLSFKNVL